MPLPLTGSPLRISRWPPGTAAAAPPPGPAVKAASCAPLITVVVVVAPPPPGGDCISVGKCEVDIVSALMSASVLSTIRSSNLFPLLHLDDDEGEYFRVDVGLIHSMGCSNSVYYNVSDLFSFLEKAVNLSVNDELKVLHHADIQHIHSYFFAQPFAIWQKKKIKTIWQWQFSDSTVSVFFLLPFFKNSRKM